MARISKAQQQTLNADSPLPSWVPPDWYPDPLGLGAARHWNGTSWSRDSRDSPGPKPVPSATQAGAPAASPQTDLTGIGEDAPVGAPTGPGNDTTSPPPTPASGIHRALAASPAHPTGDGPWHSTKRWFYQQSPLGRIAFLVSLAISLVIAIALIVHAINGTSNLDDKVSKHYGYSETGCHIVNEADPADNIGLCDGNFPFDYNSETGEVFGGGTP